jgi:hypothetical protein
VRRPLPWQEVPAGTPLYRIHPAHLGPLWFGPAPGGAPGGRFDDPKRGDGTTVVEGGGPTFGVCYLGLSAEAAFAESFLRRPGVRLVSRATFDARAVSEVRVLRALRLVAFHGPGLAALGATAAVAHGPHAAARRWARALWAHPDQPDGIAYRCRHDDDERAVALFDRAAGALAVAATRGVRADRGWFGRTLDRYRLALDD